MASTGVEVPNNQAQSDEHGASLNFDDPPLNLEEEDPDYDPTEPISSSSVASTQQPANQPLAPHVIEVDSDEDSVHFVIDISSDTSVIDLSDDEED